MTTVSVTIEVPKEGKEVIDFVCGIIRDIKAKKPVAEISVGNLGALVAAVEGYQDIAEEMKSANRDEFTGYAVREIFDALDNA